MADADVRALLLAALQKRWADKGRSNSYSIGGRDCKGFDVSKIQLKLVTIDYDPIGNKVVKDSITLDETDIRNPSGATVHKGYNFSHQYTDTFEWSITAGIKVGGSAKWETDNIPLIGKGEATLSAELSFSGGVKNTTQVTNTWSGSEMIDVPSGTSVHVKTLLARGHVTDIPFTAHLHAYGSVGAQLNYGTDSWSWQWADLDSQGWAGWSQKGAGPPLLDADRQFPVNGLFSGAVGYYTSIDTESITAPVAAEATV